jgi:chromosome segregation ATPase
LILLLDAAETARSSAMREVDDLRAQLRPLREMGDRVHDLASQLRDRDDTIRRLESDIRHKTDLLDAETKAKLLSQQPTLMLQQQLDDKERKERELLTKITELQQQCAAESTFAREAKTKLTELSSQHQQEANLAREAKSKLSEAQQLLSSETTIRQQLEANKGVEKMVQRELEDEIASLEKDLTSKSNTISQLTATNKDLNTRLNAALSEAKKVEESRGQDATDAKRAKEKIATLQGQLADANKLIGDLNPRLSEAERTPCRVPAHSNLDKNVQTLTKQVQSLHEEVTAFEAEMEEKNNIIKSLQAKVNNNGATAAIQSTMDELKNKLGAQQAKIQQQYLKIQELETKLGADFEAKYRTQSVTVEEQKSRITGLQASLDKLESKLSVTNQLVDAEKKDKTEIQSEVLYLIHTNCKCPVL